jgi:type IV pilus assembly protein PilB
MSHPFKHADLATILVDRGYAAQVAIEALGAANDRELAERLRADNVVSPEQLLMAQAELIGLPYVDLAEFAVSPELFACLPAQEAYRLGVAPYRLVGDRAIEIVTGDPHDLHLCERLERLTGRIVHLVVASPEAIQNALKRSQGAGAVLKNLSEDFRLLVVQETEEGEERTISLEPEGEAAGPVVRLVNTLLLDALAKRASDIHIETYDQGVVVKYRIDGVLYPATQPLDRRYHAALISRLKVMGDLDIAEKRVPQDGRFKLRNGQRDIDFRISVIPCAFGEDVVVRILDKTSLQEGSKGLRLETVGMAPEVLKRFRRSIHEPYGMVLITGPTGSGKTTTLYAALSELNAGEEKIITIEDPIEYQLEGIVQIPVNEKKGLTFARGLRSILRHDPDKIMVGEIRDVETAQIAVQSALTGHLVFTTVHANNAFDVISRFTNMAVDVHAFVSALNCVVAQRLVRTICPRCKRATHADAALLERSGLTGDEYADHVWYEGAGCDHCSGTGFRGREAISELLPLTPQLRKLILDRVPADVFRDAAVAEGMQSLRQSAVAKAMAGLTTLKEINRVTFVD